MKYYKKTLKNGLRIVLAPVSGTKTVTSLVLVGTGSKYETKKLNGISHFLEHLFFKGTPKRPNTQIIAEELDRVGGIYNAFTGKEFTGYWVKVDGAHLRLSLDVVSDMLLNAMFDAGEIEREKGVIIEEMNMYYDSPMNYIGEVFEDLMYGDQPAGWDIIGTKDNILRMTRNDIVLYKEKQYVANNTVVCVAGDIPEPKKTFIIIEDYFKTLQTGDFEKKKKVTEKQSAPKVKVRYKKTDQTHLIAGVRAYDMNHKDRFVLQVLAALLGGNMSSRMFINIRERQGLAYYIRTSTEVYTDSGYLETGAGIKNEKVKDAIKSIIKEYKRLKKESVKQVELQKAKEYIKGKTIINLESSNAVASFWADQEILKGKTESLKEIFQKIDKVTAGDIKRVSNNIFQNRKINLALIGPFKQAKEFLPLLKV